MSGRLTRAERRRLAGFGAAVLGLHLLGFGLLLGLVVPRHLTLGHGALGLGVGFTAYTLGLRHAFDADHIAAIDNATRRLMAGGRRPLGTGFFFSLGHSTVVFALALAAGAGLRAVGVQLSDGGSGLHRLGALVGTGVSGVFLYAIAALNLVILLGVARMFLRMRSGGLDERLLEARLARRGLLNRVLGGAARHVGQSWHLYPIGILFGLGFDTASEVALLLLAGGAASSGLPLYAVVCLPILFAAGMSLLDTLDGSFMHIAYGWASAAPVRRVYFNLTITGLSVAVAFAIGTIELLTVAPARLGWHGGFWSLVSGVDLNVAGYAIVGMFVVVWLVSLAVWRLGRVEQRWGAGRSAPREAP